MLRLKGILFIIAGSMLWGATGPMMQWILTESDMTVPFLLTIRMMIAGTLLLLFMAMRKKRIFEIWKASHWRRQLLIFSIFGSLGVQFTFVGAIDASNAVVATLLQFIAPIFVVIYVSLKVKKWPPMYQLGGIVGILVGLFLLMTNGSVQHLLVSTEGLLWGVALGFAFAFYTLYPARLMKEWDIIVVVGWSMLIGGLILGVITTVWNSTEWSTLAQPSMGIMMMLLIFFGTLAFVLFFTSMKYISAVETSILSSVEPLTAMVVSMIWFGSMLKGFQLVGAFLMLIFVTYLSVGGGRKEEEEASVAQ